MEFLEKYVFTKIIAMITGAEGQQRIRAGIVAVILAVAAKWGLPAEVADYAANAIAGLGLSLVASYTVRKPAAPSATPALPPPAKEADGVPEEEITLVQ